MSLTLSLDVMGLDIGRELSFISSFLPSRPRSSFSSELFASSMSWVSLFTDLGDLIWSRSGLPGFLVGLPSLLDEIDRWFEVVLSGANEDE